MNSSNVSNASVASTLLDTRKMLGDLEETKTSVIATLQQTFRVLSTVRNEKSQASEIVKADGLPDLEEPTNTRSVNDITLRIGLLQDALNQLMAKVSKTEIRQRMNESQQKNQEQLDKFKEQMEKAKEAAEKNKEAEKKGNVFEAITSWIQAVITVISAIVTLVSAVGQILTNPVGAAALFVASAALIGTAAIQITLAIDATLVAAGKEGFLTEDQKAKMQKAAEIMGYIALAASMIGLVGGIVVALGQAGKAAGTLGAQQVGKFAAAKMVGSGAKEIAKKSMDMTLNRVAYYAFKDSMAEMLKYSAKIGIATAVAGGANQIVSGVGTNMVADIKKEASDLQAEADYAEAAAKAIEALIQKLRAIIEQLQSELEKLLEDGQLTISIIMGAIDSTAESMTTLHEGRPA